MVSSYAGRPTPQTTQGWTSRLEDWLIFWRSGVSPSCALISPPHLGTTLPIARARQTPWLWRSCSKHGEGHLHTFGVLCHWRYRPRGYDVSQAACWQGGREEEQQLCTDRGLASVPPVSYTHSSDPAVPERIRTTEGLTQGRTSTAGFRHGRGLRVMNEKQEKKTKPTSTHRIRWQDFLSLFVSLFCEFIKR